MSSAAAGFRIINIREFNAQLDKLGEAVAHEVLLLALMTGSKPIVNRWKQIAPYRTGNYKRSIHGEPLPGGGSHRAAVQIGTDITDPPYPLFLEFGTSRMSPHPSARPAWDAEIDNTVREVKSVLKDALKKAAK